MKKITLGLLCISVVLVGCSSNDEVIESSETTIESTVISTTESSEIKNEIIGLNEVGEIKNNNEVKYKLTVTEVTDVTEQAENNLVNDTNALDYYSSGQAKQAVKVTIKIENLSGEKIGLPYLDDVYVKDSGGITNVGGWKNEGSSETEFGYYQVSENGDDIEGMYDVASDETKLATSTVLLATPSDEISFLFQSSKFNDEIQFELPVNK